MLILKLLQPKKYQENVINITVITLLLHKADNISHNE